MAVVPPLFECDNAAAMAVRPNAFSLRLTDRDRYLLLAPKPNGRGGSKDCSGGNFGSLIP